MMGQRQEAQAALFYEFSLEEHIPGSVALGLFAGDLSSEQKLRPRDV